MNQVLSQSEVDALLSAVSDGDMAAKEGAGGGGDLKNAEDDRVVVVYDLTSQDRIIRGRLPQLDVIYEKFMRAFRVTLSSAIRKIASLNHSSTDFLKFGEFINTLPTPTCISVLKLGNLRGSALFVIESKLAYALIDSFFGGDDKPYDKIDGKDFTPIELSITKKVVELAIADLEDSWESVEQIECSYVRTEVNPQFVGIVPPTDVVIASTFDVELEKANGTMTLVIPYASIEPIKQKLSSGFQVEADQQDKAIWSQIIQEQLQDVLVDIKVDLGKTEISIDKLMHMKRGDVITLDQDASTELDIMVEGVPKFQGFYGISHGSVALKVTDKNKKDSEKKG